jgi:hypothetical protein
MCAYFVRHLNHRRKHRRRDQSAKGTAVSALPAERGFGRRGSIFHGVLLLVGSRQKLDFATHPIKKRVEVSGRLGLKPLGVDGNPLTLRTSIATRGGARRRHRPEMKREIKLARLPESSRFPPLLPYIRGESDVQGPDSQRWSGSRGKPRDRLIVPVETKPRPPWRDLPFDHLHRLGKHCPRKVQPFDQVRRRRHRHDVSAGLSKYVT